MTHSRRLPAGGPSLTRICGAGFLLLPARAGLRPLPGRAGSYMISAGVGRSSGAGSRPLAVPGSLPASRRRASRFRAAFWSRSMTRPHASQVNLRSASFRLGFRHPHAEQVLELGSRRSALGAFRRSTSVCRGACAGPQPQTPDRRHTASLRFAEHPGHVGVFRQRDHLVRAAKAAAVTTVAHSGTDVGDPGVGSRRDGGCACGGCAPSFTFREVGAERAAEVLARQVRSTLDGVNVNAQYAAVKSLPR